MIGHNLYMGHLSRASSKENKNWFFDPNFCSFYGWLRCEGAPSVPPPKFVAQSSVVPRKTRQHQLSKVLRKQRWISIQKWSVMIWMSLEVPPWLRKPLFGTFFLLFVKTGRISSSKPVTYVQLFAWSYLCGTSTMGHQNWEGCWGLRYMRSSQCWSKNYIYNIFR